MWVIKVMIEGIGVSYQGYDRRDICGLSRLRSKGWMWVIKLMVEGMDVSYQTNEQRDGCGLSML